MFTRAQLTERFAMNIQVILSQTKDLTHEDSLLQLPFRGNCLNWVIGHLVQHRCMIIEDILGGQAPFPKEELARYARESEPITGNGDGVLLLERLLDLLQMTQEPLAERLNTITDEELETVNANGRSVSHRLFFYFFHESYHVGQTEILRQLAGVNDKVI